MTNSKSGASDAGLVFGSSGGALPKPTVLPGMSGGQPGAVPLVIPAKKTAPTRVRHARTLNGNPIGLVPEFISEKERAQLVAYASRKDASWETYLPESDVWHGRMINPRSMPAKILKTMQRIRKRTARHIVEHYQIDQPIYGDTLQLVRWRPGDKQAAHADCEQPDGRPNQTLWRAFASIIYLNDEYEGGAIHFPKHGFTPDVAPRTLAYFPSTAQYLHGVEEVTAGIRYTMSCFYTFDPARHDGHAV